MNENEQTIEEQNDNAGEDATTELTVGDLNSGEGANAGDEPGGIHGGPDDGTAKPAADDDQPDADDRSPAPDEMAALDEKEEAAEALDVEITLSDRSEDGLPLWQCHKTVAAFKIAEMQNVGNGNVQLIGEHDHVFVVGPDYVDKHHPQIGGYFVRYHDGYRSWSPAAAFEDGYEPFAA